MRQGCALALPLIGLVLAGCVAGSDPAGVAGAVPVADLVARLPEEAAGLSRGRALPLARGEAGSEVPYSSRGGPGAGATLELYGLPGGPVPDGAAAPAVTAALDDLLAEAMQPQPHRRLRENGRFTLPDSGPPALRCATTEGSYGRERVQGLLCAGGFGGKLLRLRLAMPQREVRGADPRSFAGAIAVALRGTPAGP